MMEEKGLILTVGFSEAPITFTIKDQPTSFVCFIGTKASIDQTLDSIVEKTNLKPSQYRIYEVNDSPEDIGNLTSKFNEAYHWLKERSLDNKDIIVDPTGGKKWMSSGATMAASFLGLQMIYVDVEYIDKKPDLNSMKVVPLGNAYDQTGFIAAEQGRIAFNTGAFEMAADYFSTIRPTISHRAEFFTGLHNLAHSLARWDRFEHYQYAISNEIEDAKLVLERSIKSGGGSPNFSSFLDKLNDFSGAIKQLGGKDEVEVGFIVDIFLNAKRRFDLNLFDDCVARLYRTLEAVSQLTLEKDYSINTSKPNFTNLDTDSLRKFEEYNGGPTEYLDLKKSFILLYFLDHKIGKILIKEGKKGLNFTLETLLNERNHSILAHGFNPVGKENAQKFLDKIRDLLDNLMGDDFNNWAQKLTFPELPKLGI